MKLITPPTAESGQFVKATRWGNDCTSVRSSVREAAPRVAPGAGRRQPIGPDEDHAGKNSYSVADDVKVGQEAAAEAKKQLPMLNDDRVDEFVENVGARLAAAIPASSATQASATPSTWSTRKRSTRLPFRAGRCSSIAE